MRLADSQGRTRPVEGASFVSACTFWLANRGANRNLESIEGHAINNDHCGRKSPPFFFLISRALLSVRGKCCRLCVGVVRQQLLTTRFVGRVGFTVELGHLHIYGENIKGSQDRKSVV